MAKRKKRATGAKRKSAPRGKVRKGSVSPREAKRPSGLSLSRSREKVSPRLVPKRTAAKKAARKRARPVNPPSASTVETVTVDVIEEAAPGRNHYHRIRGDEGT